VIYTWVYNNAKGSLLIMTLLHAAQNTASVLVFIAADGIPASGYILDVVTKFVIAVVLIAVCGPARLSRKAVQ
jgi:membrane protease YdiL (CAAX protease family)